jgi:hypothetical protein
LRNDDNVITLPEITIEGDPDAQPMNASGWWAEDFIKGFNAPDTVPERPLMINDELAANFFAGVESGQNARREMEADHLKNRRTFTLFTRTAFNEWKEVKKLSR